MQGWGGVCHAGVGWGGSCRGGVGHAGVVVGVGWVMQGWGMLLLPEPRFRMMLIGV